MSEYLKIYIPYGNMLNENIPQEAQIEIFNSALSKWTERNQLGEKYDNLSLIFYDGVIGYILYECNKWLQAEKNNEEYVYNESSSFIKQYGYKGTIYRVINKRKDEINYHNRIASWTKDIDAFDNFNHLWKDRKYTFLTANSLDFLGFDVNKYRKRIGERHPYTEHENEIIFPMNKDYIIDVFYGTLEEFKKHLNKTIDNK